MSDVRLLARTSVLSETTEKPMTEFTTIATDGEGSNQDESGASQSEPRQSTKFQKGQSGNPSGRPKKPDANLATEFRKLLEGVLEVRTPRGRRTMSREEAFVRKIVAGALKCERKAFRQFIRLAREAGELKDLRPPHNPIVYFSRGSADSSSSGD